PATDGGAALRRALDDLDQHAWLVVTSANGAARVADALAARPPGRPLVAVVGPATAAALGRTADLAPEDRSAAALGAAFPTSAEPSRASVLLVQAEVSSPGLLDSLVAKGWIVDVVAAYRTVPLQPSPAVLLSVLRADAVLFASGSAVRAWVDAFGRQTPAVCVAIGPSTAAVAADIGLKIDAVSADQSLDGLVGALLTYLGGSE
ncbi:MAG TPA: uroporphyrinogen-III synthase, partial [Ilumatobacteraceae bacterium]